MNTNFQLESAVFVPESELRHSGIRLGPPPQSIRETHAHIITREVWKELESLSYDEWLAWAQEHPDRLEKLREALKGCSPYEVTALVAENHDALRLQTVRGWHYHPPRDFIDKYGLEFSMPPDIRLRKNSVKPPEFLWSIERNKIPLDPTHEKLMNKIKTESGFGMGDYDLVWRCLINTYHQYVGLLGTIRWAVEEDKYNAIGSIIEKLYFSYNMIVELVLPLEDRILRHALGDSSVRLPTNEECTALFSRGNEELHMIKDCCVEYGVHV